MTNDFTPVYYAEFTDCELTQVIAVGERAQEFGDDMNELAAQMETQQAAHKLAARKRGRTAGTTPWIGSSSTTLTTRRGAATSC
jgi:hypothetical protein